MNEEEKVIKINKESSPLQIIPQSMKLKVGDNKALLQETWTEAGKGYKIEIKKEKVHWWKRLFRLFMRIKKC